ncbi:glutamate receptor 4-like isoform X2 [Scylla paramamosain]|uniref:glutamate receptor 4-like isoform X2 n=1 Tax=Scylla paramamosain TaxID=85552 RepID=UPI003082A3BD
MNEKTMIKIAAEQWLPYTYVTKEPGGNLSAGGPIGKLLDIFAQYLKFEYELVRPPDSYWGIKFPNGSWNGMVGMVHRNEVEMALGPFAVTAQREEDIDFSMAVLTDNQAIITIRPTLQQDVAGFLRPFDYKVWLLVLLSMVGMACGMVGVVEGEGKVFFENPKNIVSKTCLWILTTLTQESSEWLPPHDAGRVLVTTWMLASLVFMSSYGGILTAMLTVPRVTIPIDSLADLVAQDDLPWRLESGATMLTLLQESEDEVRQKAYHGMSGTIPDCWSARHGLIKGEFAAVCDMMTMKKTISWDFSTSGECHLYIANEKVYSNLMVSLAFRVDSFLLEGANEIISRLLEAGILNHWLSSETSNTTQCLKPPSADRSQGVEPLPLSSMLGTILLMAGGWSLALLIFIGENIMVATMTPSPHSALR